MKKTHKEDDVLGLSLLRKRLHFPMSDRLHTVVVVQRDGVKSGVVKGQVAVRLGQNVHEDWGFRVLGEQILVVGEVVL